MINHTVSALRCPARTSQQSICGSKLTLFPGKSVALESAPLDTFDVIEGHLTCTRCEAEYPILSGVAILVDDVHSYLIGHVKGISALVPDSAIPKPYRGDFAAARREIEAEHIEEDLESQRVTALYIATHYLHARSGENWWRPDTGSASELIDSLVKKYWDHGPFTQIENWMKEIADRSKKHSPGHAPERAPDSSSDVVELGCGVGGLYPRLKSKIGRYLGVDSSFASIAVARHLALGAAYPHAISIPSDLLGGPLTRAVTIRVPEKPDGDADFIVGDLESLPVSHGEWSVSIALNAIDMLERPALLPELQHALLKKNGIAIQSCPYVWHESVVSRLRKSLPKKGLSSSEAVEWLYEKAGFLIEQKLDHLPWLFFKHTRQLEIYSVHLLMAGKKAR